jgi:TrmH family RNA methyltransferase
VNEPITSLSNERVKRLVRLRERKRREAEGVLVIEEPRVIERALAAGVVPREIYVTGPEPACLRHTEAPRVPLAPHVMEKASYRKAASGAIVVAEIPRRSLDDLVLPDDALVLVLENVEKPGNLGAVARTASGAGVHALLACGVGADAWNPNALRASTGAVFSVPTFAAPADAIVAFLRGRGVSLLATTPDADVLHTDTDLRGPTAILLGAEDTGLTPALLDACDRRCRVPMHGAADSLNVSVTAAVLAYEAVRQRS